MYGQEEETVYKDVYRGFTAHPSSTLHVCEWVRQYFEFVAIGLEEENVCGIR